jgi:hypothetical protein
LGSEIIVCGQRFDVEHPVVTFEDRGGYSFYVPHRTDNISKIYASHPARGLERRATRYRRRRLMGRGRSLSRLRTVVRQIVVHLDGCRDAQMCYNVLHNERGLSVHFMVDNDGTIYQGLDLVDCAFHAGGVNEISIGIELQNRGDAARYPNYYPEGRGTVTCRIHGVQFLSYDFTEAQYEAMTRLSRLLTRIFDRVALRSPQRGGEPVWTTITGLRSWVGFLGHYHVDREKWDPGPWDFKRLFRSIGSRVVFPLHPTREQKDEEASVRRDYFESSEVDATAHFPVGPLGRSRLWHGGVHLRAAVGSPVGACLRGRIVAAHVARPCPVGSCSFVLIRHRVAVAAEALELFSLYFHLSLAQDAEHDAAPWAARLRRIPGGQLDRDEVVLLDEVVEAGEIIGHVGEAGPAGRRRGEIHFSVFSAREVGELLDPGYWELVEGKDRSRFCNDPAILERVDRPLGGKRRDGQLSRRELRNFFQLNARRDELRRVVAHHRSEWTQGGWDEVEQASALADLTPKERKRLVAQQITPTLWWTPGVANHAGLPADGMVYSYHPLGFLVWLRKQLRKNAAVRAAGIGTAAQWEGKQAPRHLTIDSESSKGMTDEEDYFAGEEGHKLTLEDIANGYGDDG